jgi:hypothetical protein
MSTKPKTMTEAEFARRRGVSRKTVYVWKSRGYVVLAGDGKVDVTASGKELDARPATYRGGKASQPSASTIEDASVVSIAEAIRRKEVALAKRRELDYEIASGKLVNAADIEAIARADYAMTAARILQ